MRKNATTRFTLKITHGLALAGIAGIPGAWLPAPAHAQANAPAPGETPLTELELTVFLGAKFASTNALSPKMATKICEAFGEELRVGQGPWGFGVFSGTTGCKIGSNKTKAQTSLTPAKPQTWELRLDVNKANQATVSLCRATTKDGIKCEADVVVPTSQFLPKLLANRKLTRLVAAIILDQAPFRSKLTNALAAGDARPIAQNNNTEPPPFALPPYTEPLLAVALTMFNSTGLFKARIQNTAPQELLTEKNIWVTALKRGGMGKQLFATLSAAANALVKEEQQKEELNRIAHTIWGRNTRRVAKEPREFGGRVELQAEARGGGLFLGANSSTAAGDFELFLTEGPFTNLWLSAGAFRGNYEYKVGSQSSVLGSAVLTKANRTLYVGSLGTGLRWSTASDHTVFVYPKVEFGAMSWKAQSLLAQIDTSYTDTSFTTNIAPGFGAVLGYESPERWPIQWQVRVGATALNHESAKTFHGDVAAYFPAPSILGARRAHIFGFGMLQNTSISTSQNPASSLKNFTFQTTDFALGCGYRFLWL